MGAIPWLPLNYDSSNLRNFDVFVGLFGISFLIWPSQSLFSFSLSDTAITYHPTLILLWLPRHPSLIGKALGYTSNASYLFNFISFWFLRTGMLHLIFFRAVAIHLRIERCECFSEGYWKDFSLFLTTASILSPVTFHTRWFRNRPSSKWIGSLSSPYLVTVAKLYWIQGHGKIPIMSPKGIFHTDANFVFLITTRPLYSPSR